MAPSINPLAAEYKKRGLALFDFQEAGVRRMTDWRAAAHGGINADEMGLGKTCQTIVSLAKAYQDGEGPFLVVCPLSVVDQWHTEIEKFGCSKLKPVKIAGTKQENDEVAANLKLERATVIITHYHSFKHSWIAFSRRMRNLMGNKEFSVVVVDEAQAIKNSDSQLHRNVRAMGASAIFYLLTGTPIQNDLTELYSLLSVVDEDKFPLADLEMFLEKYDSDSGRKEVPEILEEYMIRRTKKEAFKELPEMHEVVLYHGLTALQKKLYVDIIRKNADAFRNDNAKVSLVSVMMEMRKCVLHPYLFKGVEPEPFEEGEHVVEASTKFQVLDRLLCYLQEHGHRCVIFSYFKICLDIVEDFLIYRGWNYSRIDGEVKKDDRTMMVEKFQLGKGQKVGGGDPWIFMATTLTGGVGLNLTAADTVIFLDSDWNPQNDIQAMARCHRIGQEKNVRIIRLIARYTIDQYMLTVAREKLKLTDDIMENEEAAVTAVVDLKNAIKANISNLVDGETMKFECTNAELERMIGKTDKKGVWAAMGNKKKAVFGDEKDVEKGNIYFYQGKSYKNSDKDEKAFAELLKTQQILDTKRKRTGINYSETQNQHKNVAMATKEMKDMRLSEEDGDAEIEE